MVFTVDGPLNAGGFDEGPAGVSATFFAAGGRRCG